MSKKSICAVVVTYNRKELLLACLTALKLQSYQLDHIVVVNNASSDGTKDFLHKHQWVNSNNFTLINLENNQGGAGGFYEGIKFAYENNFEYIWLMDDDGIPDNDCLLELTKFINSGNYIGPLVVNKDNLNELTFSLRLPKTRKPLCYVNDVLIYGDTIPNIVMPFNGILFSRELVRKIGLPKKEYFIWGDDIEYTWRAMKAGFEVFTVNSAIFRHPRETTLGARMFFNLLNFNDTESKLKLYCMCRNNIRNIIDYKGLLFSMLFVLKVIWFYLFTKPSRNKLQLAVKGILSGFMNDFSGHNKYII